MEEYLTPPVKHGGDVVLQGVGGDSRDRYLKYIIKYIYNNEGYHSFFKPCKRFKLAGGA